MKSLSVFGLLGLSLPVIAQQASVQGVAGADTAKVAVVVPKKFIVEVDKNADKAALKAQIESKAGTKLLNSFDSEIFNGFAVESVDYNTDTLQALSSVARAWQAVRVPLPPVTLGSDFADDAAAPKYNVHNLTGVEKLHQQGYFGKGVKVGVVDTGVDYKHPALGGCFGAGCKIAGGYDFIGDNSSWPAPGEMKQPDNDPMDYAGHGTHVSGIIAGKSDLFVGVAPEATLYMYKIFGETGTDEETIIDAFLRAYSDGVDIISASVGAPGGWDDTAWAEVSRRIVNQGVVVVIAAGNDGDTGPFFMSTGGAAEGPLAVASIDATIASARGFLATFDVKGEKKTSTLGYRPYDGPFPRNLTGLPIVPVSLDTTVIDDACRPLPANVSFMDTIALVRWGGCEDWVKEGNLNRKGASFVLMYMDDDSIGQWTNQGWANSSRGLIAKDAGEAIVGAVKAGGRVTADFSLDPNTNYVGFYNSAGGKPSPFTSWGPTYDLAMKPDIAAPGGHILSTFPGGRYREYSGTSMATPYISGIAALYIGKFGGRSVHGAGFATKLNNRIISAGRAVPWAFVNGTESGFWAPPAQVGGGLIDAAAAIAHTTELSTVKWPLNDTNSFSRYHKVDITNLGTKEVEYTFQMQPAAGFETQFTSASEAQFAPRIKDLDELVPQVMKVPAQLPNRGFKVAPGQTRTVQVNFSPPSGLDSKRLPLYGGKVLISGSNGDLLSVSYLGLGGSLKRDLDDIFYEQAGYPRIISGLNSTSIVNKTSFSFDTSLDAQDFPKLFTILRYGTQELRWDIFDASYREFDWKYPPLPGQNKFVGAATAFDLNTATSFPKFDPSKDDANQTSAFPMTLLAREVSYQSWWLGKLADGTQIKPGKYIMRVAALLPFGNPRASDNWRILKTPPFEVVAPKKP